MTSHSGSPSLAVLEAVAAHEDVEMASLPPLTEWIDPDVINKMFREDTRGGDPTVSFEYAGHHVTVTAPDTIHIEDGGALAGDT